MSMDWPEDLRTVRDKITYRMIDRKNAATPHTAAEALEGSVGDSDLPNVTVSRQRLRGLLRQAVDLGIAQQVVARQDAARRAAASFPPANIQRGVFRMWVVGLVAFTAVVAVRSLSRQGRVCYYRPNDWDCGAGFIPTVAIGTVAAAICSAFASWVAYRAVLWIWRGFRHT